MFQGGNVLRGDIKAKVSQQRTTKSPKRLTESEILIKLNLE